MLLSAVLPTLFTLLSFGGAVANAHSLRAPHPHRSPRVEALAERGISGGAPHYSLYLYDNLNSGNWPSAEKISPYNRVLLAFWLDNGPQGAAQVWAGLSDAQRQSTLDSYHSAGIAVMVSAFGAGDNIITDKKDPIKIAGDLAAFVTKYGLDGVDIDFEDFDALQKDAEYALDWLTKFHIELRKQLPSAAISSTPTAWIYGNMFGSSNSVYCRLHKSAGSTIDWYNFQLYNGFDNTWDTCEHTFWNAANKGFLSVKEISDQCGIPMSMITVGKLWNKAELAHDTPAQIPAPAELGTCLAQAKATVGYPQTGMMIWVAEMNNWDAAIDYLKGTLAAMESNNANPPAVANPPSSASDAPSASASAAVSAAICSIAPGASVSADNIVTAPSAGVSGTDASVAGATGGTGSAAAADPSSGVGGAVAPSNSSGGKAAAAGTTASGSPAAGAAAANNTSDGQRITATVGLVAAAVAAAFFA